VTYGPFARFSLGGDGYRQRVLIAGDVLQGRYRLDDQIAAGGMGEVWRATDTVLARVVAVKLLRHRPGADASFRARFEAEARTMAALHHPGVVQVYDYGEVDHPRRGRMAFLVMTYIDGEALSDRIARTGPLNPGQTLQVVTQAALALHAAHVAGVVHRDVKPANLLIEPGGRVMLVDFGIARTAGEPGHTSVGQVVGTALYMAPEQVTQRQVGPAADIYALGVVAYHCLAGYPPFTGIPVAVALRHLDDEPAPLPDGIPVPLHGLVAKAMAKNPADRFHSAADMAAAAEAIAAELDTESAPSRFAGVAFSPGVRPAAAPDDSAATPGHRRRSARRRRLPVLAAVVLAAAAAAALLGFAAPWAIPGVGNPASPGPAPASIAPGAPQVHSTNVKRLNASSSTAAPGGTATSSSQASPTSLPTATGIPPSTAASGQPSVQLSAPTADESN
jgi:serine/threonine protein kinase